MYMYCYCTPPPPPQRTTASSDPNGKKTKHTHTRSYLAAGRRAKQIAIDNNKTQLHNCTRYNNTFSWFRVYLRPPSSSTILPPVQRAPCQALTWPLKFIAPSASPSLVKVVLYPPGRVHVERVEEENARLLLVAKVVLPIFVHLEPQETKQMNNVNYQGSHHTQHYDTHDDTHFTRISHIFHTHFTHISHTHTHMASVCIPGGPCIYIYYIPQRPTLKQTS